jgi:putative transposase
VLHRADKPFRHYFRRVKAGEESGYPRDKSRLRYNSLTYRQTGFGIDEQGKLSLVKIKQIGEQDGECILAPKAIRELSVGKWRNCLPMPRRLGLLTEQNGWIPLLIV